MINNDFIIIIISFHLTLFVWYIVTNVIIFLDKGVSSNSPMETESGPCSNNQSKSDEANKDGNDDVKLPPHALSSYPVSF